MAWYYSAMHDFEYIERRLDAAHVLSSPAEAQGLLCGLLCPSGHDVRRQWIGELLDDEAAAASAGDARDALAGLYTGTLSSLEDPGFAFSPLLPDAKRPIAERWRALTEWCQGFLYGLGLAGVNLEKALREQGREALKDLTEITRMDADAAGEDEEHEEALAELEEFVKVAVLLIYEDLAARREGH